MAAEAEVKIDPMHQFQIDPLFGGPLDGSPFAFTNSALWMLIVLAAIWLFMIGGMRRELVPGRWQAAVESITTFVTSMVQANIGAAGKKYVPWIFTVFIFILFSNLMGMMPFGIVPAAHPFTVTSQFSVTGVLAIISFSIVLIVGFWKHGFKFFSLFIPHGTPALLLPLIFVIELVSFMVRPFSLALRLFVAMIAGHILIKVFGYFIVQGINAGGAGYLISALSFVFITGVSALELLVCAIQAYVFALLTSLYIHDAEHLH
jgi:F-type H+-transporting ATPase subunit a